MFEIQESEEIKSLEIYDGTILCRFKLILYYIYNKYNKQYGWMYKIFNNDVLIVTSTVAYPDRQDASKAFKRGEGIIEFYFTAINPKGIKPLYGDKNIPLNVYFSAAGYYVGRYSDFQPYARDSVEYYATKGLADTALYQGTFTLRKHP